MLRAHPGRATIAGLAAATLLTACGGTPAAKPHAAAAPAPRALHGEAARVADAVGGVGKALHAGDVTRLCRPGAIFTPAVVADIESAGGSCEASVENLLASGRLPAMTVVAVSLEPRLALARVRVSPSRTVPLTLLRDGRRWLVSFSAGRAPLVELVR